MVCTDYELQILVDLTCVAGTRFNLRTVEGTAFREFVEFYPKEKPFLKTVRQDSTTSA